MDFNEIIAKAAELNNAIDKLEKETKVLNSIVKEKQKAKEEEILHDLQKYADAMDKLGIDVIWEARIPVAFCYNEVLRMVGIRIRKHYGGFQFDLGMLSKVADGFYSIHSIGYVLSGVNNKELKNIFLEKWNCIKPHLDEAFSKAFEKILEERKQKAMSEREKAIATLAAIGKMNDEVGGK